MRFSDFPLSPASLAATSLVAATLGIATLAWPTHGATPESLPVFTEEITVTAPAELSPVAVSLHPERDTWLLGESITLEATVTNEGVEPVAISSAGLYDLAVQRIASPKPLGLGDVSFLALAEAGDADALVLLPGQTVTRTVMLGADQPFDQPGRYRVSGSWLGASRPASVPAFDVVIDDSAAVAQRSSARRAPGA